MTEPQWAADARALFGARWVSALSVVLRVGHRTIARWGHNDACPHRVQVWLRRVVEADPVGARCYGALLHALMLHTPEESVVPPHILVRLDADLCGANIPPWSRREEKP